MCVEVDFFPADISQNGIYVTQFRFNGITSEKPGEALNSSSKKRKKHYYVSRKAM